MNVDTSKFRRFGYMLVADPDYVLALYPYPYPYHTLSRLAIIHLTVHNDFRAVLGARGAATKPARHVSVKTRDPTGSELCALCGLVPPAAV